MQLDKHEAAITNVNVRREKHGKEGKLGQHIKPFADKFPFQKIVESDDQQKAA